MMLVVFYDTAKLDGYLMPNVWFVNDDINLKRTRAHLFVHGSMVQRFGYFDFNSLSSFDGYLMPNVGFMKEVCG